jgi:Tol biopolymer transport system component/DNA-binding winged helix-turn-helix (wHTH) protein
VGTQGIGVSRIRFGVFELDFRTGELRKNGTVTNLPHQPCKILALLVSQPGELVTREEIQERIWGNDTHVDFENGLNFAIKRIRAVLGDDTESPRFIETLPRRGYRFIAPVEKVNGASPAAVTTIPTSLVSAPGLTSETGNGESLPITAPFPSRVAPGTETPVAAGPVTGTTSVPPAQIKQRVLWRWAVAAAAFVIVVGALAYLLRPSLPSPRVLRIVQLTNDRRPKLPYMVTAGGRLYFTEQIAGSYRAVALSAAGGEAVPIPTPFKDAQVLDISRDGSTLLLKEFTMDAQDEPIWAVPVLGGPPRRIGDLEGIEAVWSPDGQEILYIKGGDPHLYVAKRDGTRARALVQVPGNPYDIHWSPDGRRISVSIDDNRRSNMLWVVAADGTKLHPVLAGWNFPGASCNGSWTFDGKYFLFDSFLGGPDNIWAIREKGDFFRKASRQPMQLTTGPLDVGKPVPSEDGKRIFVISRKQHAQLNRYDSKSGTWKPFLRGISAEHVDFSRDGQWVAYVSYPDANLFRSKLDGSQKLQLTVPPVQTAMPRISPDGKTVAYMARTPGERWQIRLTPFSGGATRRLTSGTFEEVEPTWSPDGRSLAFSRSLSPGSNTIDVIDMQTRRISSLPPLAYPFYPRWSPDGRYIAATERFQEIVRFDLRARKWEVLFKSPARNLYEPLWSHDGQSIYFVDYSADAQGYYRLRIRDHKIEKIVAFRTDANCIIGIIGGWHALTPDGSLLILLNDEMPEIYALEWDAP